LLRKMLIPSQIDIDCELAKRKFSNFVKMAWEVVEPNAPMAWGWALETMCEHLEAVERGEIKRILINVPPGFMKSLLVGVFFPAWVWGAKNKQSLRFLSTAHKQDLAVRDNLKCRRIVTSKWYRDRWGVELTGDQNAKTKFENTQTGFREAMAFTSMTGSRGDFVILDDPLSVDQANSEAGLRAAELTFTEALPTRLNNDESKIIVIMQRLHERDTSGIITSRELGYDHLCLPMRHESGRVFVTKLGKVDKRTTDGELLFPERFSENQVRELEKTLGSHAVAGQLQQRPAPREGNLIKIDWFKSYSTPPKIKQRIIVADTAATDGKHSDWSVIGVFGIGEDNKTYILGWYRDRVVFHKLLEAARGIIEQETNRDVERFGRNITFYIENASSGIQLLQELKRDYRGVRIQDIKRERGLNKRARVERVLQHIEAGVVHLPQDGRWCDEFLNECAAFTGTVASETDDQVDVLSDALNIFYEKKKIVLRKVYA
jgi:predicted phage terminase large subunit-like protein